MTKNVKNFSFMGKRWLVTCEWDWSWYSDLWPPKGCTATQTALGSYFGGCLSLSSLLGGTSTFATWPFLHSLPTLPSLYIKDSIVQYMGKWFTSPGHFLFALVSRLALGEKNHAGCMWTVVHETVLGGLQSHLPSGAWLFSSKFPVVWCPVLGVLPT